MNFASYYYCESYIMRLFESCNKSINCINLILNGDDDCL